MPKVESMTDYLRSIKEAIPASSIAILALVELYFNLTSSTEDPGTIEFFIVGIGVLLMVGVGAVEKYGSNTPPTNADQKFKALVAAVLAFLYGAYMLIPNALTGPDVGGIQFIFLLVAFAVNLAIPYVHDMT
ncbi:hypothetical protein CEE45_16825 [Candidatus Heimdallarchaeota archaeon B3_Heim]|nr:MAG: hypothetical protein CEE45_16825 [Candidatus Heimdallarchaeota archaeon B3_Heim]